MVIDTSAVIAVIFKEAEAEAFRTKISNAESRFISAATLLEAAVVLRRQTKSGDDRDLNSFLAAAPFQVMPFDQAQSMIARDAYQRFGQNSGHPARLNFGDCFAYAHAKHLGVPLLFKGNDFGHTDVTPA